MSVRILAMMVVLLFIGGCEPSDQRPGLWLSGKTQAFPDDWSFTQDIPEIGLEVATPYFIPHSVTIWCVSVDGDLYIAAAAPETKKWPSWVNDDPNILIKIGDQLFEAQANPLDEPVMLARLKSAYGAKYDREVSGGNSWFWSVVPRA